MPRQITPVNNGQTPGYSVVRPQVYGGTSNNSPAGAAQSLGFIGNALIDVPNGAVELGIDGRIPATFFPSSLLNQQNPVVSGPLSLVYNQVATYTITNYVSTYTYSVTAIAGTATISGNTVTYTAPNISGTFGFIINGVTVSVAVTQAAVNITGPTQLNENQVGTYTITNYNSSTNYNVTPIQGTVSISGATITYTAPAGNGINTITAGFTVNGVTVPVTIVAPPTPNVSGPSSLAINQVGSYTITNYQAGATYLVSASTGTVSISGSTITYTAPNTTGVFGFTINSVNVAVNVVLPTIQTPSILSPVAGATNLGPSVTFTASAFAMTSGTDTQSASNWQLAFDSGFTNIVQQSLNDSTNLTTWTVNNLAANTTYFARVQYIGQNGETSQYSSAISFTTKAVYVPSAITAKISSGVGNSHFGIAVSINSTGTIAIIGAYSENNGTGAAYIYTNQNGIWKQTSRLASGVASSNFGNAVSINSDGNIAIIGAYAEGAAYIYTNQSGTWTQTARLASVVASGEFGYSVSINSTGTIAVIGVYGGSAVYIYTNQSGTWKQTIINTETVDYGAVGTFYNFVSINSDGTIAVIGSNGENGSTGAAYIYTNQNGTWTQTARLSSGVANSYFGSTVSINSTGTIAIIGAPNEFYNAGTSYVIIGAAYIFNNQNGTWTQTARLASGVAGSYFGNAVSINNDGTIAIIGAYNENAYAGAAYIYTNQNGTWTQTARMASGVSNSWFGDSVSINSDGTVAIIGAFDDSSSNIAYAGAAYIAQ